MCERVAFNLLSPGCCSCILEVSQVTRPVIKGVLKLGACGLIPSSKSPPPPPPPPPTKEIIVIGLITVSVENYFLIGLPRGNNQCLGKNINPFPNTPF